MHPVGSKALWWSMQTSSITNNWTAAKYQMVGPARTIFHLCGMPRLVSMIDSPAYLLQDEIVAVPWGCGPASFLLGRYSDEGKIAWDTIESHEVAVFTAVPTSVTPSVTRQRITGIYPLCRPVTEDETVKCERMKHEKNAKKFATSARNRFDDGTLEKEGLMFRGLSLSGLERCLTLFVPVIHSSNSENEFGPGLYTTDDLELAKVYAGNKGAILVFKSLDERGLNVWRPGLDAWNSLTASWLKLPLKDVTIPPEHQSVDVIVGPASKDQHFARMQKRFPTQSADT